MFTLNLMYWINVAFAVACACLGNFIQATIFLAISAIFMSTELAVKIIVRELKNVEPTNT